MLSARELAEATAQLQTFRREGEQHFHTQSDILGKYSALLEDYKRLQSDHEEARDSRDKYKQLVRGQDRDPFVLVLLDGDGYVFEDSLVSNGADGGSRAAGLLNDAIKTRVRHLGLDHCRIMVRIYANLAGLSKALAHVKLCGPEKRSLAPFVANFNRSGDLFDFVDAGELKENADFKIRGVFRQFVESTQCKHIFLGVCHDVGYVSELQPYVGDKDRITLIKHHASHREFSKLNLREEELHRVFRNKPLGATQSQPKLTNHNKTETVDTGTGSACTFYQKGTCKNGTSCSFKHVKETASPMKPQNKFQMSKVAQGDHDSMNGNSNSIRRATNGTNDPAALLPREEDFPPGTIALNNQGQRIDPYAVPSSRADRAEFEARVANKKLCNNYHMGGYCPSGAACLYDHTPITPHMLECLKFVARHSLCPKRGECRSVACYLGHICQQPDCKHRGGKSWCKIPFSSHNVDLRVAEFVPGSGGTRTSGDSNTSSNGSIIASDGESDDGEHKQGASISSTLLRYDGF